MENDSKANKKINPLDLDAWRREAEDIAIRENLLGYELDALRHTYVNAMVTWQYGVIIGVTYANALGGAYEASGLLWVLAHDVSAEAFNLMGAEIEPYGISYQVDSSLMDLHNNNVGVMIGSSATSKEDLVSKVINVVRAGMTRNNPDGNEQKKKNIINSVLFQNQSMSTGHGGLDPSSLIDLFGGSRGGSASRSSSGAPLFSALSLARGLAQSRKRSFEKDLLEIFTGARGGTEPIVPGSSGGGGSASDISARLAGTIIDMVLSSVFARRTRTRTSSEESTRSIEERERWSLSRSQQQALMAQQAQQGARNL